MSALQKTGKPTLNRIGTDQEILIVEPSQLLFRVVVNNYKQQIGEALDSAAEAGETITDDRGLPPQPTGYLKFPTYDPF